MGLLDRIKQVFNPHNTTNINFSSLPIYSLSGEHVTAESGLRQSCVYACVKTISEIVASLPLRIYKTDWISDREFQPGHPLYYLLNFKPNPIQSGYEFKQCMAASLVLNGVAYAFVQRDIYNRPISLSPIDPSQVSVVWDENREKLIYYIGVINNSMKLTGETFTSREIMHIRGFSKGILSPLSPIVYGSQAIGLDQSLTKHQQSSFGPNSTRPSGVIQAPTPITSDTAKRIMELFKTSYSGAANTAKIMFLDSGIEFKPLSLSDNVSLQLIQNKEASLGDICRYFGVPPAVIGHTRDSSYQTVEQVTLHFLNFCLKPLFICFSEACSRDLLKDPMEYEIAFDYTTVLTGSLGDTSQSLTRLLSGGLISPNEGRAILGKDAKDGEEYDSLFLQQNMIGVSQMSRQAEQNSQTQQETAQLNKVLAEEQIKLFKEI